MTTIGQNQLQAYKQQQVMIIQNVQEKIKEMGPGPFTTEQEKTREKYTSILTRAQENLNKVNTSQQELLIRNIKAKLVEMGPGPYTPEQQIQVQKFNTILERFNATQQPLRTTTLTTGQPIEIKQEQHGIPMMNVPSGGATGVISYQQQPPPIQIYQQPLQQQPPPHAAHQQHPQHQLHQQPQQQPAPPAAATTSGILDKRTLQELVKEVDPTEQLEDDVEEILLQIADDFIENVINASCQLAKHRKSNVLEAKDVQFHLEKNFNIWIPGFGPDDLRPIKKLYSTEAHKQRLAMIKKTTVRPPDAKDKAQN